MSVVSGGTESWFVQYHPEYDLDYYAGLIATRVERMCARLLCRRRRRRVLRGRPACAACRERRPSDGSRRTDGPPASAGPAMEVRHRRRRAQRRRQTRRSAQLAADGLRVGVSAAVSDAAVSDAAGTQPASWERQRKQKQKKKKNDLSSIMSAAARPGPRRDARRAVKVGARKPVLSPPWRAADGRVGEAGAVTVPTDPRSARSGVPSSTRSRVCESSAAAAARRPSSAAAGDESAAGGARRRDRA